MPRPATWWWSRLRAGRRPPAARARPRHRSAGRHQRAGRRHRRHHPQVRPARRPQRRSGGRSRALGGVVRDKDLQRRTDFRQWPTVTIDGEHARDFDDAISIDRLPNGNFWLGVHIADVAHYVAEGSALDPRKPTSARRRSTFPERAVHMFPSELSTGALQPEPARRSARAVVPDGSRSPIGRGRALRDARRRDPQPRADDLHRGQRDPDRPRSRQAIERYRALVPMFERMHELFEILHARRRRRGSIDFDLKESADRPRRRGHGRGDRGGRAQRRAPPDRGVHAAGERDGGAHLEKHDVPSLYRIHEEPDPVKVEVFEEFISTLGYSLGGSADARAARLPAARREDPRQAGGEADRVPDAADDAEGAVRPGEPRPLRPGRRELHALHVADPPLSRSGRAPDAARVAARA